MPLYPALLAVHPAAAPAISPLLLFHTSYQASDRPYIPAVLISRDGAQLAAMSAEWESRVVRQGSQKDLLRLHIDAISRGDVSRLSRPGEGGGGGRGGEGEGAPQGGKDGGGRGVFRLTRDTTLLEHELLPSNHSVRCVVLPRVLLLYCWDILETLLVPSACLMYCLCVLQELDPSLGYLYTLVFQRNSGILRGLIKAT